VAGAELYLKEWRPQGRRVAVVSNSGATCVMAADTAYDLDLELASLSPVTVDAVASQLPSYATVTNPIDITAALLTNSSLFETILARLAADDAVDMLFVGIPVAGAGYDVEAFGRAAAEFADTTGRPIVVAAPQESVARAFRERGVPTFANQTEALGVLKQLAAHTAAMRRPLAVVGPGLPVKLPAVASRFLNEADGLSILERHGFPTVVHRLCASEADARTAFRELGVPVVVKACSTAIPHKSDHGLVVLDIVSETGVTKAFRQVTASAHAMGVHLDGVIVAAMALGRRELMIGARVDPTFGAVVMIGDGGRYVEALSDVAVLLPPMTVDAVRDALRRLRIAPILAGVRGEPALDVDALSDVAERLCQLVIGSAGQIASIDLNPVIVQSDGRGLVIVDALVERAPESIALRTEARAGAAAVSPGT
jgi:acyl-CoA synthetase (NDP forming)